ncbi:MAG: transglutaminase family protein [Nocardioides sp.]
MTRHALRVPDTALVSLVAALTTWVTLLAWSPFGERPSTYLVPLLGICLLIAVSGALLRATRMPAVLVLLVQVALVALVLHHSWAGDQGLLGGWLPTSASLDEAASTLGAAADAASSYPAPVPKSVTEFAPLMVAAGAGTALVVDFIACGLRRAPIAGLPLLAVYTAPVSILDGGVSWLKFGLAALCYLFLITCQEESRLAHWGQQVTGSGRVFDTQQTRVSSRAVWSSARKIGLTATGLAVLVPILVPTMSLGLFAGSGPGDGPGEGSVSLRNPMVNMRRDLTQGPDLDLVRVTTKDPDPTYLRVSVLDEFDGEAWEPSQRSVPVEQRAAGLVPRPPGLDSSVPRKTYPWAIQTSEAFGSTWLPAPYPVFSLTAPGDWRYDRDTLDFISFAKGQEADGLEYDLERIDVDVAAAGLDAAPPAPASVFGPNTELPQTVPESVRELARTVTQGAGSKFEMAQMLQRWFRTEFEYSTRPAPGNGTDDLVNFLADEPGGRIGYCEQFAAAMSLMGRSLAIPSRVAVGFLRAEPDGEDSYIFSSRDLHAWPEMYFESVGWVRFEPTPGQRSGAVPSYTRGRVGEDGPSRLPSESTVAPPQSNRIDATTAPAGTGSDSGDGSSIDLGVVLAGTGGMLALLALLALPRALRAWVRSRRWDAADTAPTLAEAAWAELRDTAVDLGVAWDDDLTVRSRARETVRSFGVPGGEEDALARTSVRGPGVNPDAEEALVRLVGLVERARYARDLPAGAAQVDAVRADLDACVEALEAGAGKRRRTQATWLPRSLWARWVSAPGQRARDEAMLGDAGVDHAI